MAARGAALSAALPVPCRPQVSPGASFETLQPGTSFDYGGQLGATTYSVVGELDAGHALGSFRSSGLGVNPFASARTIGDSFGHSPTWLPELSATADSIDVPGAPCVGTGYDSGAVPVSSGETQGSMKIATHTVPLQVTRSAPLPAAVPKPAVPAGQSDVRLSTPPVRYVRSDAAFAEQESMVIMSGTNTPQGPAPASGYVSIATAPVAASAPCPGRIAAAFGATTSQQTGYVVMNTGSAQAVIPGTAAAAAQSSVVLMQDSASFPTTSNQAGAALPLGSVAARIRMFESGGKLQTVTQSLPVSATAAACVAAPAAAGPVPAAAVAPATAPAAAITLACPVQMTAPAATAGASAPSVSVSPAVFASAPSAMSAPAQLVTTVRPPQAAAPAPIFVPPPSPKKPDVRLETAPTQSVGPPDSVPSIPADDVRAAAAALLAPLGGPATPPVSSAVPVPELVNMGSIGHASMGAFHPSGSFAGGAFQSSVDQVDMGSVGKLSMGAFHPSANYADGGCQAGADQVDMGSIGKLSVGAFHPSANFSGGAFPASEDKARPPPMSCEMRTEIRNPLLPLPLSYDMHIAREQTADGACRSSTDGFAQAPTPPHEFALPMLAPLSPALPPLGQQARGEEFADDFCAWYPDGDTCLLLGSQGIRVEPYWRGGHWHYSASVDFKGLERAPPARREAVDEVDDVLHRVDELGGLPPLPPPSQWRESDSCPIA